MRKSPAPDPPEGGLGLSASKRSKRKSSIVGTPSGSEDQRDLPTPPSLDSVLLQQLHQQSQIALQQQFHQLPMISMQQSAGIGMSPTHTMQQSVGIGMSPTHAMQQSTGMGLGSTHTMPLVHPHHPTMQPLNPSLMMQTQAFVNPGNAGNPFLLNHAHLMQLPSVPMPGYPGYLISVPNAPQMHQFHAPGRHMLNTSPPVISPPSYYQPRPPLMSGGPIHSSAVSLFAPASTDSGGLVRSRSEGSTTSSRDMDLSPPPMPTVSSSASAAPRHSRAMSDDDDEGSKETDYNGEGRLQIQFQSFGTLGSNPPFILNRGPIPNGISGFFSSYNERWQFRVTYGSPESATNGRWITCVEWAIRNTAWETYHIVRESLTDAIRREDRGVTVCNRVFTEVLEIKAREYEAEVDAELAREPPNQLRIANFQSRIKLLRPKRISEGPLMFGLRHRAVHNHFFALAESSSSSSSPSAQEDVHVESSTEDQEEKCEDEPQ